mmetsp:Transcript_71866/g.206370  ORF Transcript_71866/g.206370 Transcript_71866/m.206370 type:complete len:213 (+) Transcript_71866:303-941(+)
MPPDDQDARSGGGRRTLLRDLPAVVRLLDQGAAWRGLPRPAPRRLLALGRASAGHALGHPRGPRGQVRALVADPRGEKFAGHPLPARHRHRRAPGGGEDVGAGAGVAGGRLEGLLLPALGLEQLRAKAWRHAARGGGGIERRRDALLLPGCLGVLEQWHGPALARRPGRLHERQPLGGGLGQRGGARPGGGPAEQRRLAGRLPGRCAALRRC